MLVPDEAELVSCQCPHSALTSQNPSVTYAGTSGHSGTDTSRERAEREDNDGVTSQVQRKVLQSLKFRGVYGNTVAELRDTLWMHHHGQVSSALTNLHRAGRIARLSDKRNRCKVYVLPEFVNNRDTEEPTRQAVTYTLQQIKDGTGFSPDAVFKQIK
jgi:hypothetical protein